MATDRSSLSAPVSRGRLDRLYELDEIVLVGIRRWQRPRADRCMRGLTRAGNTPSWIAHGVFVGLLAGDAAAHCVLLLTVAALLATGVSQVLKRSVRRPRPNRRIHAFVPAMDDPDAFSFPSGHTTVAFAVATALLSAHGPIGAVELVFALAVGSSRVYLGAHYPLDVGAGALLGMVCGRITVAVVPLFL